MFIVTEENFGQALEHLMTCPVLALDTETSGLRPYHSDTFFSIAIADSTNEYYFSFHPEHPNCLTDSHLKALNELVFAKVPRFVLFNAKFDMAMLATKNCYLRGHVTDTKVYARLLDNQKLKYDLASCAKEIGMEKGDAPEKYIKEFDLWEWEKIPGRDARKKKKFYDKIPYDIIAPYACQDVRITFELYKNQLVAGLTLSQHYEDHAVAWPSPLPVFKNEDALVKTIFDMERCGVKVNIPYCQLAAWTLTEKMHGLEEKFYGETGVKFKDSPTVYKTVFCDEDYQFGAPTATGRINPKFDSSALARFKSPAARTVLLWRDAKKTCEYFTGFLYHADRDHVIHPSFVQDGTVTGRMSANSPNMQNLTKDEAGDDADFLVRRAFIPRDGYFFAMFDYDQMEYKLMLDYAGASELIEKVAGGQDVHQATADVAGISRSAAKTTNFSVLYGAGINLLAQRLGVTPSEAHRVKKSIFDAAPEIEALISRIISTAERREFIFNWYGRRYLFPNPKFSYRAPNYLIQGGCADIVKIAMNRIAEYLKPLKSRMLLMIHDELVIECHMSEKHILPTIKNIMESVYTPQNGLPMTCGLDYSYKNLADKIEGFPREHEAGDKISQ